MAVGQDAIGSRGGDGVGGVTSFTCSVTVSGSNSNRALFVTIAWETAGPITVTGVTTNQNSGASLTSVGSRASGDFGTAIYRLANPDAATHTLTVTFSGNIISRAHAVAYSLYDVDQTTPEDNYTSATASNALTQTSNTGDYALLSIAGNATPSSLSPSSADSSTTSVAFAHASGAASISWTWSGPAVRVANGCSVKAASGGGESPAPLRMGFRVL